MSEPMSSHEIEDVLSSIRRLVSEDLRPAPRAPEGTAPHSPAPADKLLLTPALRVVAEPEADQQPLTEPLAAAPSPQEQPGAAPPDSADPVEDVVTRLGAAVPEEDWESPFGDPEIWPGQADDDGAGLAAQGFVAHPRVAVETGAGSAAEGMPPDFLHTPMSDFAEVEDVVPDTPPPPAQADVRAPLRRMTPPQAASDWAEAAEAAVRADLAQEAEEEVISGLYDAEAGGMVFDEEVLRDLVRDLIREELSGTLGERITRNVRKLVRAEIARAMALREFE